MAGFSVMFLAKASIAYNYTQLLVVYIICINLELNRLFPQVEHNFIFGQFERFWT
ncbi:hypothetical protein SM14BL03_23460 [Serratia marcescens]|nr:hypothetical protein SM14BL03_23460 [Serratia marcescens]